MFTSIDLANGLQSANENNKVCYGTTRLTTPPPPVCARLPRRASQAEVRFIFIRQMAVLLRRDDCFRLINN